MRLELTVKEELSNTGVLGVSSYDDFRIKELMKRENGGNNRCHKDKKLEELDYGTRKSFRRRLY